MASAQRGALDDDLTVVDANVHVYPEEEELVRRLPERYREKGVAYPTGNWASPVGRFREDTREERTGGSDPDATRAYLDAQGVDRAVITGGEATVRAAALPDSRYGHALTSAYNDWLVDTWLDDERFLGSIAVSPLSPEPAAEEIRRLADHPGMVQVVVGDGTQIPLGQEKYWPIYEAAAENDLPVAIHAGCEGYGVAYPNSGGGYPSTYLERLTVTPCTFMGHLLSLVVEGVFVEFPDLQVVLVGSGFGWLPSFLWRVDKVWKGPSQDVPWVSDPPSEYVRDHVTVVTNVLDEADTAEHQRHLLDMAHGEELLAYGSEYPHWDAAEGGLEFDHASADLRAFFSERATALYGL